MLDEQTIQELKSKLEKEKAHLEKELNRLAVKTGDNYSAKFDDYGEDEDDSINEVTDFNTKLSLVENLEYRLKEISEALKRIESGKYGICENCTDKNIPIERLKANPAARLCTDCEQK